VLLRDRAEAEDAAQQASISAHRALLNGSNPREPAAWLATIARHECWARIRTRMREPLPVDELQTASLHPDPLAEAIRRADLAALWAAIEALPRQQRDPLLLREFGGLSYEELSDALAVSEPAIERTGTTPLSRRWSPSASSRRRQRLRRTTPLPEATRRSGRTAVTTGKRSIRRPQASRPRTNAAAPRRAAATRIAWVRPTHPAPPEVTTACATGTRARTIKLKEFPASARNMTFERVAGVGGLTHDVNPGVLGRGAPPSFFHTGGNVWPQFRP